MYNQVYLRCLHTANGLLLLICTSGYFHTMYKELFDTQSRFRYPFLPFNLQSVYYSTVYQYYYYTSTNATTFAPVCTAKLLGWTVVDAFIPCVTTYTNLFRSWNNSLLPRSLQQSRQIYVVTVQTAQDFHSWTMYSVFPIML